MYTDKKDGIFDATTASDLTSAAVAKRFGFMRPAVVRKCAIGITTATVSTGNIVVTIKKYPNAGSSASAETLDTITIPAAIAAGKVYLCTFPSPEKFIPGEELVFEVTTAAAGGGAAGAGTCMFEAEDCPDYAGNNTHLVASA